MMKVKKTNEKSPETSKELSFWRFSFRRSEEKKMKKKMSKISYDTQNHDEGISKTSESDDDSVSMELT